MISDLKKRYDIILSRETALARAVAAATIKQKPLSVWEVLLPIIFIFSYIKSRESREVIAQNVMFTKKMAMQAALDMLKNDQSR